MKQLRLNYARDAIFSVLNIDTRAQALHEFLKRGAQVFILAGAVRDAITSYYGEDETQPRDFDIAVANIRREIFDEVLPGFGSRNRHGGYRLSGPGFPDWDIWRLEETIGIKKTGVPCSLENVLRTFNLNCNAVALDVRTGLFLDAGAVEAIRYKRLGFAESSIRHSIDTFAAKALLLELRLNYLPTNEMRRFITSNLDLPSLLHETAKVFPRSYLLPLMEQS